MSPTLDDNDLLQQGQLPLDPFADAVPLELDPSDAPSEPAPDTSTLDDLPERAARDPGAAFEPEALVRKERAVWRDPTDGSDKQLAQHGLDSSTSDSVPATVAAPRIVDPLALPDVRSPPSSSSPR